MTGTRLIRPDEERASVSSTPHANYGDLYAPYTMYATYNPEIWKPNDDVTNQGHRALQAQRGSLFANPKNNPARMQFSEGYTMPLQQFMTTNTYNTPSGQTSKGKRATQPSQKLVSPFTTAVPLPTRMPWDL
jgi:hypothetical protein